VGASWADKVFINASNNSAGFHLSTAGQFVLQTNGTTTAITISTAQAVTCASTLEVTGSLFVNGDSGGKAGCVTFCDVADVAARSTGIGTILFDDATDRNSSGFIKVYIGTTAYYVPVFLTIT
jgi:hypothetical protein